MKLFTSVLICSLFSCFAAKAQQVTDPDKSPMDMCYSPQNYPILKFQTRNMTGKLNGRVIYSRPQVKERDIFGTEVKYNELWRLGANESTELDLYKNAVIGGKTLPKGRYTLYCVPSADAWEIIVSKDVDSWGGFSYQKDQDVVHTKVAVAKNDKPVEYLTMYFDTPNSLTIMWADAKVSLPIKFATN